MSVPPLTNISTIIAVESLFQGPTDVRGTELAAKLTDLFIYNDRVRYIFSYLSAKAATQGVTLPWLLSALMSRDSDVFEESRCIVSEQPRGHRFVRYADDSNIYVRSERAGQRVMESVTRFITQKLKLKVNGAKSAVGQPQERKFLGFSFTAGPEVKRAIAPKAMDRFKQRIREITRRAKGVSIETTIAELAPYMRGWCNYFGFCETPEGLVNLTRWVRLRLRAALWRQWKTPRRRQAALIAGVGPQLARNNRRHWAQSPVSHSVQGSQYRAFKCVLPVARSSILDRGVLA